MMELVWRDGTTTSVVATRLGLQITCVDDEVSVSGASGDVGQRCRECCVRLRGARNSDLRRVDQSDHVHMLIGIPPIYRVPGGAVHEGKSSHKLLSEFAGVRKQYWRQHLWARGYWVARG